MLWIAFLVYLLMAAGLYSGTEIGLVGSLIIPILIFIAAIVAIGIVGSIEENAKSSGDETKLARLQKIRKVGKSGGITLMIIGIFSFVYGTYISSEGQYGYEMVTYTGLDGNPKSFISTVSPAFTALGLAIAGIGVVLLIVALAIDNNQKKK